MCDYSLEMLLSHPATVGEKLVATGFSTTVTRGFTQEGGNPNEAVCLLQGTEVGFDENIRIGGWACEAKTLPYNVAVFSEIDREKTHQHHDALEFPDGSRVLVHNLIPGQKCSVLQLPKMGIEALPGQSVMDHVQVATAEEEKETAIQRVIQRVAELIS
jgi:hypothetical protein